MARQLFLIRTGTRHEPEERELARRRHLAALQAARERHRFADPQLQLLDAAHARRHLDAA